jgi:hypothetical protein
VAAPRGRLAARRARCTASTTSTASTRSRSAPPTASRSPDPIACKPAVMAETDDWVAMASEFRAIAVLPGAENARIWEPAPGHAVRLGRSPRLMAVDHRRRRDRRSRRDPAARPEPAPARPRRQRRRPRSWRDRQPVRQHNIACGLDADDRRRDREARGLLLRRHEQARTRARDRQRGRRASPRT